jgi:hypothetical protein
MMQDAISCCLTSQAKEGDLSGFLNTRPSMGALAGLLIIPTSQHSVRDLVRVGAEIEEEKDELLEKVALIHRLLLLGLLVTLQRSRMPAEALMSQNEIKLGLSTSTIKRTWTCKRPQIMHCMPSSD